MVELRTALNPEQYRAAVTTDGPLLVLAGAGSGKTRVLVHRIAHILERRLAEPWQILAVTFTNKAASEMKHRLEEMLGPEVKAAWIGTFHSMCGRILRRHAELLGLTPSFTIYDQDDARRAVKRLMKEAGLDTKVAAPAAVHNAIDRAKNRGVTAAKFVGTEQPFWDPARKAAQVIYPRYTKSLRESNAVDFGDLLLLTVELLENHPDVRQRWQRRFRYLLVDEFQDTNKVQYDVLKRLVNAQQNLAVVGDDDQSIYGWRGAQVQNILDFPRHFSGCTVVKLEQNYRSSANILNAANAVIARNKSRHPKTLFTDADAGLPVGVAMLEHSDDEAQLIAGLLADRIDRGEEPDHFAILYRQNAQSRLFEIALRRAQVPYSVIGAAAFFERKEVKDVLSYLRVIANPSSTEDFERIINVPPRKIGDRTLDKLRAVASECSVSGARVLEVDKAVLEAHGVKGKTLERLLELGALLQEVTAMSEDEPAVEVAQELLRRVQYLDYLQRFDPTSAEDRIANVEELVQSIAESDDIGALADPDAGMGLAGARTPLQAFLDQASLSSSVDRAADTASVSLMTLHAAKGLEFPVVFMVGMEEQTFPTRRAIENLETDAIEEERRLCYVGMTRAMKELHLMAVRYRGIFGQVEVRRPSRFLGEIPGEVVGEVVTHEDHAVGLGRRRRHADPPDDPFPPPPPETDHTGPIIRRAASDRFAPGVRVLHNTFGEGVIERVDGEGPKAHLTIRFSAATKRVVARYVEPLNG